MTVFSTVGFGDITAKSEFGSIGRHRTDTRRPRVHRRRDQDRLGRCATRSRTASVQRRCTERIPAVALPRSRAGLRSPGPWVCVPLPRVDAGRDVVGAATAQVDRSRRCRSRCSPTVRAICGSRWLSREQDWAVWRGSGLCYPLPCPTRPRGPPSRASVLSTFGGSGPSLVPPGVGCHGGRCRI